MKIIKTNLKILAFHTRQLRIHKRLFVGMAFSAFAFGSLAAHEPLFMMSHEAPGKEAFDFHTTAITNSESKESELEIEFSYGLTRDMAIRLGLPIVNSENPETGKRDANLRDPVLNFKWRFWDRDLPGKKYAVAWAIKSTLPIGNSGKNVDGSIYPVVENGISTGMESLKYYYFFDLRYKYFAPRPGKPGDRIYFDFSPGWRPHVGELEDVDVVFFLEFNYLHIKRRETLIAVNRINDFIDVSETGNTSLSFPLDENFRMKSDRSIQAQLPGFSNVVFDSLGLREARKQINENLFLNQKPALFSEFRVNDYYVVNEKGAFTYKPAKKQDRVNRDTGGDVLFIAPDILVSTSNRLMFRFGVQIPIWKNLRRLEKVGTTAKFSMESRF